MNACDVKQVKNITASVKSEKKLTKDEIYNLNLLGYHLEGFIPEIKVFPDLVAILGEPEMLDVFNQLFDRWYLSEVFQFTWVMIRNSISVIFILLPWFSAIHVWLLDMRILQGIHSITLIRMGNQNISVHDSYTGKTLSVTDSKKIQLSKIYRK